MNSIGLFIKEERLQQKMSQEALSEGICSNTYLSKIESGFSGANEEIITLLVESLGYQYNLKDEERFLKYYEDIWERLFRFDLNDDDYEENLINILDAMRFSRYSMDVYLLKQLVRILVEDEISEDFFNLDTNHLTLQQRYHYASIISIYNYGLEEELRKAIDVEDKIGFISYYKTSNLFLDGHYRQAIQRAEHTYKLFSDNGNVMGMINISFLESSSYSNLNDNATHIKISERIRRLNTYVKKADVEYFIDYNLGSSYLVQGDFQKAEYHLLKCMESSFQSESNLTYEKLILVYLFTEDFDKAASYLKKVSSEYLNSYTFLSLMLETQNDLSDDRCIKELEDCYHQEYKKHHGRRMLFGTLLYNAYRSTYQYPKALKLIESLQFNEIPLFFKK